MEQRLELANGCVIRIAEGDITRFRVDAIANAANASLVGGGGVDGAIHRAGGPELMRELDGMRGRVAPLAAGKAVATTAGRLRANYVFHAVGPVYRNGRSGEPEALASCYRNCLEMAEERGCTSISFPSISTGVYGYPLEEAGRIAIAEVRSFLETRAVSVREVLLVLFGRDAYEAYLRLVSLHAGR